MRLQFIVFGVLIALVSIVLWVFSQNVSSGYVVKTDDGYVKVVQLPLDPLFPLTEEQKEEALKKAARSRDGQHFALPIVNEKLGSSYMFGEHVRIYWRGEPILDKRKQEYVEQTLFIMR